VGDLVVLEVVPSEQEAQLIVSVLEHEGIRSFQRQTSFGAGATDGMPAGGAREVVVRTEDADSARKVLELQRRTS
jgi:hypothetical protein